MQVTRYQLTLSHQRPYPYNDNLTRHDLTSLNPEQEICGMFLGHNL